MTIRNVYTCFIVLLCSLCLSACGEGEPISTPIKIVAFGDSLTAGYQLPSNEAVPARLQERFMAKGHTGIRIVNMGISGDTTRDGLSRLNLALEAEPDIIILALGANDMLRQVPAEKARENLEIMIQQMQERGITVILSGVAVPALFMAGNEHVPHYKPMFDELASRYNLDYYPNFLAGVLGKPSANLPDGLHPNSKGAQEIADRLYPIVLRAARDVVARSH